MENIASMNFKEYPIKHSIRKVPGHGPDYVVVLYSTSPQIRYTFAKYSHAFKPNTFILVTCT
jgi:hypothetical protein